MLYADTQVVVQRKLVTTQHFRPREAVVAHARLASGLYGLTESATREDGSIEADWSEQRTEEHLGVLVTANVQQWNPATSICQSVC